LFEKKAATADFTKEHVRMAYTLENVIHVNLPIYCKKKIGVSFASKFQRFQ